jgi:GntR family transcriptional regulator, transcriptional repressor for pyruvate dehydrogenase complex
MAPDPQTPDRARFAPVHGDASERIAHEIRLYLERNDLQPGDRIGTEKELAREFGVSRPTLREAVRLLTGTHLIRVSQGRTGGIFVASTVNDSIGHNVSVSVALEGAIEEAQVKNPAHDDFRLADARFHEIIARAAGNQLLMALTRWSLEVLQPSLIAHIGDSLEADAILDQHRDIVRAIRRRQPAAARRAMERHLG